MTNGQEDDQDTQETPGGLTIPRPSREDVEDALAKLIAPAKPPLSGGSGLDDEGSGEDGPVEE